MPAARSPAVNIDAARSRAWAKADKEAAARGRALERARARREARKPEIRQTVIDSLEHAKSEPRDRDPLVEALDKRRERPAKSGNRFSQ